MFAALLLVTAACSSAAEDESAEPVAVTDDAAVETIWIEFVTAAAGRAGPERLAEFATAEVIEQADIAFFEPRLPQTFYPQITIDGDVATIEDCSLFSFPLVESPHVSMSAVASRQGDGGDRIWQITDLDVRSDETCLPGDLAAEILGAYERFWDNELTFSNPPDPNHPLIRRTLTGRRLQRKRAVLEWQVENSAGLRGRPITNPQIVAFSPGLAIVADCQTPAPETGFYDLTTGERRPETPLPTPGQTDLVRTWFELDSDIWKVEFSGVESDADCDSSTISDGIAVIGQTEGS